MLKIASYIHSNLMDFNLHLLLSFIPIFILLSILVYFVNIEIKRARDVMDASKRAMRDKYEKEIQEKNKRIVNEHHERFHETKRLAEFGKLSRGLFHDLINPLTSIILHTKKLEDIGISFSKENKKTLENAISASERMSLHIETIQSILRYEDSTKMCSFKDELYKVLDILSYRFKENNISIKTSLKDDYVWFGNPIQIQHIYLNLISNSIDSFDKVRDQHVKKIEIKAYIDTPNYIIEISDNGSGIKDENISKIFEPFFSTKDKNKGIGIGLTMVKSIIEEKMNGKIEFSNNRVSDEIHNQSGKTGGGVTFKISLPL